jgi:hypothetical protein
VNGEIWICASQTGKKKILEGANGAFGRVILVNAGWNKLEVDVLLNDKIFEDGGAFVVEAMQLWTEAGSYQYVLDDLKCIEDFLRTFGWHSLRVDAVASVVIQFIICEFSRPEWKGKLPV